MLKELNQVINYIEKNLTAGITLEEISEYAGVSDYHFRKIFYCLSGLTLSEYIKNRKLSEANKDLLNNERVTDVAKLINRALNELVIDGIRYEQLADQSYEMKLFEEREIEEYLSRLYEIQHVEGRTPYDYIVYDSEVEREIAQKLDSNQSVRFFCKLPRWFVVPTPLGGVLCQ